MDPNILNERVNSLSTVMDIVSYVTLGVGSITVAVVIALVAMFFVITNKLSSLQSDVTNLKLQFETKFGELEKKFDEEIATRQKHTA